MEYKFKQIKLSDAERLWLTEILKANFSKPDMKALRVKLWGQIPEDFDPNKIDLRLICDNHLTLIGLWHVDPQNAIFKNIEKIVEIIKGKIRKDSTIREIRANEIATLVGITEKEAEIALKLLSDIGHFFGGGGGSDNHYGYKFVNFREGYSAYDEFLRFKNLEQKMEEFSVGRSPPRNTKNKLLFEYPFQQASNISLLQQSAQNTWDDIKKDYGVSKHTFGKKIHFVKDKYKRDIIFRDVEQAYILVKNGFYKPATLLAGGVIEELLRLCLETRGIKPSKNSFEEHINLCKENGILKSPTNYLSSSVRHFRNLVHLEKENSPKDTISKAAALGTVSSIFTIVNDF
jgi:hypothetical protein